MSKLACRCGHVMVANTMEEDFLYDLLPEKATGEILENWEKIRLHSNPDLFTNIYMKYRIDTYLCPVCGRFLIEDPQGSNRFSSYVKETK